MGPSGIPVVSEPEQAGNPLNPQTRAFVDPLNTEMKGAETVQPAGMELVSFTLTAPSGNAAGPLFLMKIELLDRRNGLLVDGPKIETVTSAQVPSLPTGHWAVAVPAKVSKDRNSMKQCRLFLKIGVCSMEKFLSVGLVRHCSAKASMA